MSKRPLPQARPSKRAPYQHGETWDARHRRRLRTALEDQYRVLERLRPLSPAVETFNDGAHWKIDAGGRHFEWWPETGRLIVDKRWDQPRKAHDVDQAVDIIRALARRGTADR